MAVVRMIDARWACLIVARLREQRIPTDPLVKKAGLTRRQVSDPEARIPYHKHAALLSLAAEATGDGCFGLRFTTTLVPKQAGVLGYVLLNSATLGDALINLVRFLEVFTDALEFDLEVGEREAVMVSRVVDPLVEDPRAVVEYALGLLHRFCQLITGRSLRLNWVAFRHAEPPEAATVREIFRAPVLYGQDRNAVGADVSYLDLPIEEADDELLKILKHHCELILGTRPEADDLEFQVRELVTKLLPSGQPKVDAVAQEFGMSPRTLTRRLAAHGLTYKGLVDDVRRKLALQYLEDRRISVKHVAYLLGYSEVAAFYHAFQRWTGSSPAQQRMSA